MVHGPDQIWRGEGPLPLDKITDGRSNTIAVVEACGQNIVWNEPRDIDVAQTPLAVNLPGARPHESPALISSPHTGGGHMAMADGSIRFRSAKIDPAVLKALTTATGSEPLGEF